MKKLRIVIRIITALLLVLSVVGIVLLIINSDRNWLDTSYEIIAFSLGSAGMIMAVISQIDTYQQEKTTKNMIADLHKLNREADEDDKVDARFQRKLDKLLSMDEKIYHSITSGTKTPAKKP